MGLIIIDMIMYLIYLCSLLFMAFDVYSPSSDISWESVNRPAKQNFVSIFIYLKHTVYINEQNTEK